jgi:hypothetical protein
MSINYFIKSGLGLAKFDPNTQMITESVITLSGFIDAHKGKRWEVGGTSCTPSEDFEKFGHKNAIKHENRGPPRFFKAPCTHSKEFENDCGASIVLRSCHFKYFVILTDKKTITDPITR